MTRFSKKFATCLSIALGLFVCISAQADILLNYNSAYTQNFDTLASTGTTGTTFPDSPNGWTFLETLTNADTSYGVGTGSGNAGNTYSFGVAGTNPVTDRAFGELTSGTLNSTLGTKFTNSSGNSYSKIKTISYYGEQWRSATALSDKLDFQYSLNATSLTTGTWVDVDVLDFVAPVTAGTVGLLDGNAVGNQTLKSVSGPPNTAVVFASSVAAGGTFWIRWVPRDSSGADDGLGIDTFSIQAIPEPSSIALCGLVFGAMGIGLVRRRRRIAS